MKTYKRHRFSPDIISSAVWLYHRFNLSNRDTEDLLAERGITVSYEAIRLWCIKFGARYAIHNTERYANNRAEQSHDSTRVRERGMRRFKSPKQAQRFLSAVVAIKISLPAAFGIHYTHARICQTTART